MTSMGTVRRLLRFRRWIPIGVTVAIAAWVCAAAAPQAFSQDPASIGARLVTGERHPLLFLSEPSPVESATGTVSTASSSGVRFDGDPRSAATADFNGDGMPDLLVGYGSLDGAFVTLYAGNVDYLFPEAARTWLNEPHAASNDSPFLPGARTVPVPVDPDFLGTGDFDADGHNDFVLASRTAPTLYWFRGNSRGGFSGPSIFELDGLPNALLVADLNRSDGLPDIALAISSRNSAEIWILEGPNGALRSTPERFPLPEPAGELTAGDLDGDSRVDLAAALPEAVLLIHGRDRMLSAAPEVRSRVEPARVVEYPASAGIRSILAGDFLADARQELAVLLEDSSLRILESSDDGLLHPSRNSAEFDGLSGDRLAKGRFSSQGHEQLLTWKTGRTALEVLLPDQRASLRRAAVETSTMLLQALPLRLDPDAFSDLVFLSSDGVEISVAQSGACSAGKTLVVNDPGNQSDSSNDGVCDVDNNPSNGQQCTFRGALAEGSRGGEPFQVSFAIQGPLAFAGEATQPVCIDGGSGVEGTGNVTLSGGNSVVRGLHFLSGGGIEIQGDNNFVEGNRLDNTGVTALNTSNATIGGTTDAARNVVGTGGISINCITVEPCPGNQILGNFVGTDETGEQVAVAFDPGAGRSGVYVYGNASGTLIRDNVIAGFNLDVWIDRSQSTLVQGNRIGTNRTGTEALFPESTFGVSITWSKDDLIGGTAANLGNLISGHNQTTNDFRNEAVGVYLGSSSGTKVQGNKIGTDLSGQIALPNGKGVAVRDQAGRTNLQVEQAAFLIGGDAASAGNLLSGNLRHGLELTDRIGDLVEGVPDVQVIGNLIGTNAAGTTPLPNENDGLRVMGGIKDALIKRNVIAFSGGAGVGFSASSNSTGVSILENSIHSNQGLGIDLARPGVNPNDDGDSDAGANNGQNFPELHLVTGNEITWSLDSPAGTYLIEFFSNSECDDSSVPPHGEGRVLLGSREESITPGQVLQFPVSLNLGTCVAATATAIVDGLPTDTSEFSECKTAVSDRDPFVVNSLDDAADADLNDPICSTGGEVEDDLGSKSPKCTLRAAIQQANANSGTDRIEFKVPSREFDDGLLVVSPATALPAIQEAVTIDAYSQTGSGQGASRIPVVVLDGRSVAGSGGVHGFTITGSNSEITGFVIQGFSGYGISISGPGGNRITGNLIGTDADGQTAVPNQAGGIEIDNSPSNTIGGTATLSDRPLPFEMPYFESNVISGNTASGIVIGGPDSTENSVLGNLIGPTSGFEAGSGNRNGILVLGGANSNTIGPGNTISANTRDGVLINTGARENRIVDNAIGIEISRLGNTVPLGNGKNGVHIDGAPANTIGGLTTANRNIISANAGCGIVIEHGATQNKVLGNFIGTDHQGTFAVPNGDPEDPSEDVGHGILLDDAPANQIGGLEEGATNVISGNFVFGVAIRGTLSEENVVQGNHIGLSVDGYAPVYRADLRTQKGGILIGSENAFTDKGAPRNTIGGEDPAARNLLSGNHAEGLSINGQSSTGNKVQGNYIGVDISGQAAVVLPVTSESGVPRQFVGLHIYDSPGNIIGGGSFPESGCVSPCNVISGNDFIGVEISGSSTGNEVLGNVVGTVADGTAVLPDPGDNHPQRIGIELGNATSNSRIGKAGQGNLISGNRYEGIGIWETTSNRIEGNRIGTDRTGTAPIGNGTGIDIGGSSDNRIGGSSVADGNLIAWNRIGVEISEGDGNSIRFNSIFENDESGIRLSGGNQGSILPNVLSASSGGRIWGGFFRSPSTTGVLDFYSNPSCPGPAACLRQGRTYLGSLPFQAGATRFDFLPPVPLTAGQQVTATTTDAAHSTSSFSLPVEVRADQDGDGAPDSLPGENENNPRQFSTGGGTSVSLDRTDLKLEGDPNAASPTAPTGIRVREILSIRISTQSTSSRTLISTQALAPGSAVTLTVNLADGVEATTWYNFGPTPDDPTEHWYEFLFDGTTGAEILEDRILLHFLDGARGDHDLAANGTIETFGGPSTIADLYFPYLPADPATFVGLAVSNFSDRPASLTFRALGGSGIELDVPDNPASQVLTPETQLASLATEIFGAASATGRFGWIVLDTDNPRLGSFFQFGDTSRLDGSVAVTEPSRSFRFTRVFEGDSAYRGQPASTQLVVANPGTETASVSFSLKEPGGNSIRTSNRTIAGHGVLSETVSELFGSGASGGYIETQVTNGPEVVGFQTISLRNQNTTMGLAPAVESMSNELFSAQLVSAPGLFTSIKLINSSSQNRTVTLTAMADNGGRFADPVTLTLVPGGSLEEDASALFVSSIPGASSLSPAGDPAVLIGSLRAVSDGPGIVGDVLFGDSTGFQYAAALPLQSIPFREAVFSQFANLEGFFTGLAFLNPGLSDAQLTIDVVRASGEPAGHAQLDLPAGERLSKLVVELAPETEGEAGGYVLVRSNQPILAQVLFGAVGPNGQPTLFSAVPPTAIR